MINQGCDFTAVSEEAQLLLLGAASRSNVCLLWLRWELVVSKPAMKARCESQNLLCRSLPGAAGFPACSQGGGCRAGLGLGLPRQRGARCWGSAKSCSLLLGRCFRHPNVGSNPRIPFRVLTKAISKWVGGEIGVSLWPAGKRLSGS